MIFDVEIDLESQILALFDISPLHQFSKFYDFLWVYWFLGKNFLILYPPFKNSIIHITLIQGKFKDGKAEGPIKIDFLNGQTMEGVAKDGALHGIARILEPSRPIRLRSR